MKIFLIIFSLLFIAPQQKETKKDSVKAQYKELSVKLDSSLAKLKRKLAKKVKKDSLKKKRVK